MPPPTSQYFQKTPMFMKLQKGGRSGLICARPQRNHRREKRGERTMQNILRIVFTQQSSELEI